MYQYNITNEDNLLQVLKFASPKLVADAPESVHVQHLMMHKKGAFF